MKARGVVMIFVRQQNVTPTPSRMLIAFGSWSEGQGAPSCLCPSHYSNYLVIKGVFGGSSGDHSLNDVFRKNSDPVLEPTVSLE